MDSEKLVPRRNNAVEIMDRDAFRLGDSYDYSATADVDDDQGLTQYLYILVKQKWLILACVVVTTVLVAIWSFKATPIYDAIGRIEISHENSDALGLRNNNDNSGDWDDAVVLDTQAHILQSDPVAREVLEKLGLANAPGGTNSAVPFRSAKLSPVQDANLLAIVQRGLSVKSIPRTRLLEIHYSGPDPRFAAQLVNVLTDVYIEHNFKAKFDSTMQTSDWIQTQMSDLLLKVESSQEKLVQYQREHGILGLDEKQNIITSKLDELNKELTRAETDRIQKESIDKIATSSNPELVPGIGAGPLQAMRVKEADLKTQLAQASTQFGPSYPKVRELSEQLKAVQANISQEIANLTTRTHNDYLTASQREKMVRASLEAQKQEANKLNESAIEFNNLKREAESNRTLYESLRQKLKEAGVTAGLKSSNVRVVDPARVPTTPVQPNKTRNIALAFIFSLAFGIGLAFVIDMMDNSLRRPDQVQSFCGLPAIAMIPLGALVKGVRAPGQFQLRGAAGNMELVSSVHPSSTMAESFRALRTSLLLSRTGASPQIILITSALPQEGKTTTAMNSAIVLAQNGARVLLVDADMRRPSVHKAFSMPGDKGLSTYLAGVHRLDEVVRPAPAIANLSVLPAGKLPAHPAELLSSLLMRRTIAGWREQYDHVIIDTPPSLSVTDAVLLSVEADSVIVVVRSGRTTKQALRRVRDLLANVNARVAGVVVNGVDFRGADYDYYYGYSGKKTDYDYNYGKK
jgi:succinoglycan biosynthesis transport protein ExoP